MTTRGCNSQRAAQKPHHLGQSRVFPALHSGQGPRGSATVSQSCQCSQGCPPIPGGVKHPLHSHGRETVPRLQGTLFLSHLSLMMKSLPHSLHVGTEQYSLPLYLHVILERFMPASSAHIVSCLACALVFMFTDVQLYSLWIMFRWSGSITTISWRPYSKDIIRAGS